MAPADPASHTVVTPRSRQYGSTGIPRGVAWVYTWACLEEFVVCGVWCVVCGVWCVVCGVWGGVWGGVLSGDVVMVFVGGGCDVVV